MEVDDTNHSKNNTETNLVEEVVAPIKKRGSAIPLNKYYKDDDVYEIGVDEAGRGPLFGRVYTAAVILPKDDSFQYCEMKDSKKFHSKKKITEVANYIKTNALYWSIQYEDEKSIDSLNILQATQKSMHNCIKEIIHKSQDSSKNSTQDAIQKINTRILVDGNYFNAFTSFNNKKKMIEPYEHICIEGGDNKYSMIAAASILAKVARDEYIQDLCEKYPTLAEYYSIDTNKGYGAKKHLDGIKLHGITEWHRKSFAPCRNHGDTTHVSVVIED